MGTLVAVAAFVLLGVVLALRYSDRGRTGRLERCIEAKRPMMEEGLGGIGLKLGVPEIWLADPEREEFAMFPIEGEKPGAPKRFFRVHSGAGIDGGEEFCRAALVDGGS